ncbi:MAG: hypothetical protein Kow0010_09970 [Dehalococcoidia bacterium]
MFTTTSYAAPGGPEVAGSVLAACSISFHPVDTVAYNGASYPVWIPANVRPPQGLQHTEEFGSSTLFYSETDDAEQPVHVVVVAVGEHHPYFEVSARNIPLDDVLEFARALIDQAAAELTT